MIVFGFRFSLLSYLATERVNKSLETNLYGCIVSSSNQQCRDNPLGTAGPSSYDASTDDGSFIVLGGKGSEDALIVVDIDIAFSYYCKDVSWLCPRQERHELRLSCLDGIVV